MPRRASPQLCPDIRAANLLRGEVFKTLTERISVHVGLSKDDIPLMPVFSCKLQLLRVIHHAEAVILNIQRGIHARDGYYRDYHLYW